MQTEVVQTEDAAVEEAVITNDIDFEYKLVGVNVHSGSANAGHYWSYINTVRGLEEKMERIRLGETLQKMNGWSSMTVMLETTILRI